jgi:hypothetical protein
MSANAAVLKNNAERVTPLKTCIHVRIGTFPCLISSQVEMYQTEKSGGDLIVNRASGSNAIGKREPAVILLAFPGGGKRW